MTRSTKLTLLAAITSVAAGCGTQDMGATNVPYEPAKAAKPYQDMANNPNVPDFAKEQMKRAMAGAGTHGKS